MNGKSPEQICCPLCKEPLFRHFPFKKAWLECQNVRCWFYGMEGSPANWLAMERLAGSRESEARKMNEERRAS